MGCASSEVRLFCVFWGKSPLKQDQGPITKGGAADGERASPIPGGGLRQRNRNQGAAGLGRPSMSPTTWTASA